MERKHTPFGCETGGHRPRKKRALNHFQRDYAKEVAPAEYATMNEAQRDSWFLQETKVIFTILSGFVSATSNSED